MATNSGMFCFVGYKRMRMGKRQQVREHVDSSCLLMVCFVLQMLVVVWFGLCCKLHFVCVVLTVVPYCDKASSACPLQERRRQSWECE